MASSEKSWMIDQNDPAIEEIVKHADALETMEEIGVELGHGIKVGRRNMNRTLSLLMFVKDKKQILNLC